MWFRNGRYGACQVKCHDGFWKSHYDFLIVFLCNFSRILNRWNATLVLLICYKSRAYEEPLGGVIGQRSWRIVKVRHPFSTSVLFVAYRVPRTVYALSVLFISLMTRDLKTAARRLARWRVVTVSENPTLTFYKCSVVIFCLSLM